MAAVENDRCARTRLFPLRPAGRTRTARAAAVHGLVARPDGRRVRPIRDARRPTAGVRPAVPSFSPPPPCRTVVSAGRPPALIAHTRTRTTLAHTHTHARTTTRHNVRSLFAPHSSHLHVTHTRAGRRRTHLACLSHRTSSSVPFAGEFLAHRFYFIISFRIFFFILTVDACKFLFRKKKNSCCVFIFFFPPISYSKPRGFRMFNYFHSSIFKIHLRSQSDKIHFYYILFASKRYLRVNIKLKKKKLPCSSNFKTPSGRVPFEIFCQSLGKKKINNILTV